MSPILDRYLARGGIEAQQDVERSPAGPAGQSLRTRPRRPWRARPLRRAGAHALAAPLAQRASRVSQAEQHSRRARRPCPQGGGRNKAAKAIDPRRRAAQGRDRGSGRCRCDGKVPRSAILLRRSDVRHRPALGRLSFPTGRRSPGGRWEWSLSARRRLLGGLLCLFLLAQFGWKPPVQGSSSASYRRCWRCSWCRLNSG